MTEARPQSAAVPARNARKKEAPAAPRSMVQNGYFDKAVPLPPGVTTGAVKKAIAYVERELSDEVDWYFKRLPVFNVLARIFATKALDANSVYEKRRHKDKAQTQFPDLKRRGSGEPPAAEASLECKASKRPWAVQSHYDHPGWYIVWRYLVDPTSSLEEDRPVIIWRVDVVFLEKEDWKYEGSKAGVKGGGRTHTFGLSKPASVLKGKAVYERDDVAIMGGKAVPANNK